MEKVLIVEERLLRKHNTLSENSTIEFRVRFY